MSMNTTFKDWDELMDYLKDVTPPQCFLVNYKPETEDYSIWIGNQPYESYEELIERRDKENLKLRKEQKQLLQKIEDLQNRQGTPPIPNLSRSSPGYKQVKNYLQNDLKIGKEEVRALIKEHVDVEVNRVVTPELIARQIDQTIEDYVRMGLDNGWKKDYRSKIAESLDKEVSKQVSERLSIDISIAE